MGFWRALFGNRRPERAAIAKRSPPPAAERTLHPELLEALAPIGCEHGHENRIAIVGMTAGQSFACSTCGSSETIDQDLLNEIERMFISQVRKQIVSAGSRPPGDHALRFLRAYGRWASADELRADWRLAGGVPNPPGVIEHETFALGGCGQYQTAIAAIAETGPVVIEPGEGKPGALIVRLPSGEMIGNITARHPVAKAISEGNSVLFSAINSISRGKAGLVPRMKVATGPPGAVWTPWVSEPRPAYPLGLVGERNYQRAIRRCSEGDAVDLFREPDNPYDNNAIVAVSDTGETLGYVPRGNWLARALLDDGKGCRASIKSIGSGDSGLLGVVLDVQMCAGPLGERAFVER